MTPINIQSFEQRFCLQLQGGNGAYTLYMESTGSFETFVTTWVNTESHKPEAFRHRINLSKYMESHVCADRRLLHKEDYVVPQCCRDAVGQYRMLDVQT